MEPGKSEFHYVPKKFLTPRQERILTQRNEMSRFLPPPCRPTLIHKLSMISMVWNISTGQPGYLPGYALALPAAACLFIS